MNHSDKQINEFILTLSKLPQVKNTVNLYSADDNASLIRRRNLQIYLREMTKLMPTTLFVGEAPGYKGCKLTGIPFTSEQIMLEETQGSSVFGESKGYQVIDPAVIHKEQSATIIWSVLSKISQPPLLWNAFPMHPFKAGDILSNRKPNLPELEIGKEILKQLIKIFDIQKVVAVGNSAQLTLTSMGIDCPKVRHPANGGKAQFLADVKVYFVN